MRSGLANLIYWPGTTNLFLKIPLQLLFTHCRIPLSIWRPQSIWISDWDRSIKRTLNLRLGEQRIEDRMLQYGCNDSELLRWNLKTAVVVVNLIFLKHNGLCGRLTDSNYSYADESIPCTNFRVCVTLFVCTLRARSLWRPASYC